MNCKVEQIMARSVIATTRHKTAHHARELMAKHRINALPVVDDGNHPIGVLTSSDLMNGVKNDTRLDLVMTKKLLTISEYEDVSVAARMMRNAHVHHLIVTREKKLIGMLSSYDILKLVEERRFTIRNAPTPGRRAKGAGGPTDL